MIKIANAPCSWGVLEFEAKTRNPGYEQVLDEIAQTGYVGTELGEWGFMPSDPGPLRDQLARRGRAMVGAFVPPRLPAPASWDGSLERAVTTASLLAAVGGGPPPLIVL